MYAEGEGVPRDDVQALMWFTLAADQNHKDAMENRDNAVSNMTADQIAAAKKTCARVEGSTAFASWTVIANPEVARPALLQIEACSHRQIQASFCIG
jgi:TPR repeat protein